MDNITDNPDKASGQDEQDKRFARLLGNGKGSSTKPDSVSTGNKQSKAKGGHGTRQQHSVNRCQLDFPDIDRIINEHGPAGPLLGYWTALNRIAFRKDDPFVATYAILRIESRLADRQISECNKKLEALGMLRITREKGTKKPNTYKLLKGYYVDWVRPPKKGSAPSQKTTTPPPADTRQEPPETG